MLKSLSFFSERKGELKSISLLDKKQILLTEKQ